MDKENKKKQKPRHNHRPFHKRRKHFNKEAKNGNETVEAVAESTQATEPDEKPVAEAPTDSKSESSDFSDPAIFSKSTSGEDEKKLPVPFVEVVSHSVKAAVRSTKNKKIGVLATPATIKSGAHKRQILELDALILIHKQR